MRKLRALIEGPYGRWFMLGLLIFILCIFTVTDQMMDLFRPGGDEESHKPTDVAGRFSVLKGDKIEITFEEYEAYKSRFNRASLLLAGQTLDKDLDIWTFIALREAARREGIVVDNAELRDIIRQRVRPNIWNDKALYKSWVFENFGVKAPAFEESVRDLLTVLRVREVYQDSYRVAPPTTRAKTVEQYASQNIEFARGHYAALDAERFLQDAADELKAESKPDEKLKSFFETDPAVKVEDEAFRNPRRTKFEAIVTVHKLLNEKNYKRIEDLFKKAYPDLDVGKLEPNMASKRDFYGLYPDRLLGLAGLTEEKLEGDVREEEEKKNPKDEKDDGDKKEDDGEEKKDGEGDGEEKEGDDPADDEAPLTPELRKAIFERGLQICDEQIDRELRLRGIYAYFHDRASKNGDKKSLKEVFDHLKKFDDKDDPILSTDPDKGLIVYLDFSENPLSGDEVEKVKVHGEEATHNLRIRLNQLGDTDLPKVCRKQDVYGSTGHGRMIFRVIEVVQPSRKTYDQLTEGEKEDLKDDWYLPAKARERAKAALEELRKKCVDGKVKPQDFRAEAEKIGCRFYENEWIRATSYGDISRPKKAALWPDEYRHMLDRYFLTTSLAQALARDRVKKELDAGSYVEVLVDTRRDTDDPGAAYLFLLLERRKPDAKTIPPRELDRFLVYERRKRESEDRERWTENIEQVLSDFDMEFEPPMDKRVQDELKRRAKAKAKRRARGGRP